MINNPLSSVLLFLDQELDRGHAANGKDTALIHPLTYPDYACNYAGLVIYL
jgi:hypothetical protein